MVGETYDVVVVGAGPAGATAAGLLARAGHRVALVDQERFPRTTPLTGWLSVRAAPLLAELGIGAQPLLEDAFRDVTFFNADFTKKAKPHFREPPGFLIDRCALDNALITRAVSGGVTLLEGRTAVALHLKESTAVVHVANAEPVEGRLLILATGHAAALMDQVGIKRDHHHVPVWCAQVEASLTTPQSEPRVAVVLGLDRRGGFGLCFLARTRLAVAVYLFADRSAVVPALQSVCRAAFEQAWVPLDLSSQASSAKPVASPASAGLEMEAHVAKHTLVIGDAGGFVCAASNEGTYPAMWSAQIATEVAHSALEPARKGAPAQDELKRFDTLWRVRMADYLRSPHSDVQFLLPLIFSNQPMADRMGAAFFSGENM